MSSSLTYDFDGRNVKAANFLASGIGSVGDTTLNPDGDLIFNPGDNDVILAQDVNLQYTDDFGTIQQFLDNDGVMTNVTQLNVDDLRLDGSILSNIAGDTVDFGSVVNFNNLGSEPGTANVGDVYYHTGIDALRLYTSGGGWISITGGGGGDVNGPASSTDEAVAVFDMNSGKLLKNTDLIYTTAAHTLDIQNAGGVYQINSTAVLSSDTLGSGIVNSSLENVGTLTELDVDNLNLNGNTISTTSGNMILSSDTNITDIIAGDILRLREDNPTLAIFGLQYKFNGSTFCNRALLSSDAVNRCWEVGEYASNDPTDTFTPYARINVLSGSTDGTLTIKNINLDSGGLYQINSTNVLTSTTLGGGIINSSLTSVGALTSGSINWSGNVATTGYVQGGNLRLSGNTLSSQNTNGDITVDPNGTGQITLGADVLLSETNILKLGNTTVGGVPTAEDTYTFQKITEGSSEGIRLVSEEPVVSPIVNTHFQFGYYTGNDSTNAFNEYFSVRTNNTGVVTTVIDQTLGITKSSITNIDTDGSITISPDQSNISEVLKGVIRINGNILMESGKFLRLRDDAYSAGTADIFGLEYKDLGGPFGVRVITNTPTVNTFFSVGSYTSNNRISGTWADDFRIFVNTSGVASMDLDGAQIFTNSTTLASGVVTSSLTTVGALTSGSIASGFGTISTGNTITSTTDITGGSLKTSSITISGSTISTSTDVDLTLSPAGTGNVIVDTGVDVEIDRENWITFLEGSASAPPEFSIGLNAGTGKTGVGLRSFYFSGTGDSGTNGFFRFGWMNAAGTTWNEAMSINNFTYDMQLNGNLNIASSKALTTSSNDDLSITPGGTGNIVFGKSAVLYKATSDPVSNLTDGMLYYDSDDHLLRARVNSTWTTITTDGALGGGPYVNGPGSSTDEAVALFDGTGGYTIQNSNLIYITASNALNIANAGGAYQINGSTVLSATTLGTAVTGSFLTSTGILTSGSIASGFGTISTANTITTTSTLSGGELVVDNITINGNTISANTGTTAIRLAPDGDNVDIVTGSLDILIGSVLIGGTNVLSSTTLGSTVVSSSLTSVGALASGSIASGFGSITTTATITGGVLVADNLTLDGNTISSTNTNGDITLAPNGTGSVVLTTANSSSNYSFLTIQNTSGSGADTGIFMDSGAANASWYIFPSSVDTNLWIRNNTSTNMLRLETAGDLYVLQGGLDIASGSSYNVNGTAIKDTTETLTNKTITGTANTVRNVLSNSTIHVPTNSTTSTSFVSTGAQFIYGGTSNTSSLYSVFVSAFATASETTSFELRDITNGGGVVFQGSTTSTTRVLLSLSAGAASLPTGVALFELYFKTTGTGTAFCETMFLN